MVSAIHDRSNQWGRKDPFTPTSATRNVEVQIYKADGNTIKKGTNGIGTTDEHEFKFEDKVKTTINNLIQNPSTHYDLGNGTHWVPIASTEYYKDTKEGDWWNPTIKTIYDPCPNGYRIPKDGTYGTGSNVTTHPDWSVWSEGGLKSGRIFKNTSFFPASGYRFEISGKFNAVGSWGFYWMSTISNPTYGGSMDFMADKISPYSNRGRSRSYPLRCIKE